MAYSTGSRQPSTSWAVLYSVPLFFTRSGIFSCLAGVMFAFGGVCGFIFFPFLRFVQGLAGLYLVGVGCWIALHGWDTGWVDGLYGCGISCFFFVSLVFLVLFRWLSFVIRRGSLGIHWRDGCIGGADLGYGDGVMYCGSEYITRGVR